MFDLVTRTTILDVELIQYIQTFPFCSARSDQCFAQKETSFIKQICDNQTLLCNQPTKKFGVDDGPLFLNTLLRWGPCLESEVHLGAVRDQKRRII